VVKNKINSYKYSHLLARYEIPATIFITTNLIATNGQLIWALEIHERLVSLSDSNIEISGTTYTHYT
jgi:peptidoglycan/xylan/chitin deacetylase (PgdA/CDA1 family)